MATTGLGVPAELADDVDTLTRAVTALVASTGPGKTATLVQLLEHLAHKDDVDSVLVLLESLELRDAVLQHVTDTIANQPLPLGPATAGQIALVDQAWREIESHYGVLDAGQYAELVGAAATSRSVASKAKAKGLVGYRRGRRILYPRFQFDERGLRAGWNDIVAPLRDSGWDDADIVLWLAAPHGALGRRSPVEALDAGDRDLVFTVIDSEAAGVW